MVLLPSLLAGLRAVCAGFPAPRKGRDGNIAVADVGHGKTFLAMTLAALNLLAFAWHTALGLLEPPWQAARQAAAKRTAFFAHILTLTAYVVFPSWTGFIESIANFTIPPELLAVQKNE